MSLKTYLLSSSIGATGTTTIAIPSAYAYGNGLVNSDTKLKEIRDKNEGLKNEKLALEKETVEANEAAEKARGEKQTIDEQNEVLKTTNKELNNQYETQKKSADNWATQASSVSGSANEISNRNKALIGEKVTLENENSKLQTQLNHKNTELSVAKGTWTMKTEVTKYIKEVIDDLGQFEKHKEDSIYPYLKGLVGNNTKKPEDLTNYKWHCKEHRWTKDSSTQRGLAYCVLKETEESRSADATQYTSNY